MPNGLLWLVFIVVDLSLAIRLFRAFGRMRPRSLRVYMEAP